MAERVKQDGSADHKADVCRGWVMKVAKTKADRVGRQLAERTVDLYLEVQFSSDQDAGWQGDSIIGKLVDFWGDLPVSSGYSGFSKVWEHTRLLGDWSDAHLSACAIMRSLPHKKREAVAIDRSYRNRVKVAIDPFVPEKTVEILWDDQRCADGLECTVNAFRKRIAEGYQEIENILRAQIQQAA